MHIGTPNPVNILKAFQEIVSKLLFRERLLVSQESCLKLELELENQILCDQTTCLVTLYYVSIRFSKWN